MEGQLPLSNLNDIPVEGMEGFTVVSGNSMECARSAAIMAKATGSVGANEFRYFTVFPPAFKNRGIEFFAIVRRNTKK
jgi:hypothetical protein